jgi:hypothetical protein
VGSQIFKPLFKPYKNIPLNLFRTIREPCECCECCELYIRYIDMEKIPNEAMCANSKENKDENELDSSTPEIIEGVEEEAIPGLKEQIIEKGFVALEEMQGDIYDFQK